MEKRNGGRKGDSANVLAGTQPSEKQGSSCRHRTRCHLDNQTRSGGGREHPLKEKNQDLNCSSGYRSLKKGKRKYEHHLGRRREMLCPLASQINQASPFPMCETSGKKMGESASLPPTSLDAPNPSVSKGGRILQRGLPPPGGSRGPAFSGTFCEQKRGISAGRPHCPGVSWRCCVFWCRLRMDRWLKLRPQAAQQ